MKAFCILALLGIVALLIAPVSMASGIQPAAQPVLFGKAANNGDLLGLYYTDPLGQTIIVNTSTMVPLDSLDMVIYSPFTSGPVNLTIYTFTYSQENLTLKGLNNSTVTRTITIQDVIQYDNQSLPATARQIQVSALALPSSPKIVNVEVAFDGAIFIFTHRTTPNSIPVFLTQGGELGLVIVLFILSSLVWSFGALTSKMILKRARYWPKRSASSWVIVFFILGIALYFFLGTYYYDLGYIQWYYFLLPVWILSVMVMLGWWDPNVERWALELTRKGNNEGKMSHTNENIYVAPHARYGFIKIDRDSRLDAIRRVLGIYTPVKFYDGPPPWSLDNEKWEDPIWDTKRTYYLDPKRGEAHTLKKEAWRFWLFSHHVSEFHIPLSGQYMKKVAEFWGELTSVIELAKENEELFDENVDLRIKVENAKARVSLEKLIEITKKLRGVDVVHHTARNEEETEQPKGAEKEENNDEERKDQK